MRRAPNPWVLVPSLMAGLIGGALGWVVADVSCRPGRCPGWSVAMSVLGFLVGLGGMVVVVVLALRSLAEWRDHEGRPRQRPED